MKAKLNLSIYPTTELDAENNIIIDATILYEKNQLKGFLDSVINSGELETNLKKLIKNNIRQVVDETNDELEADGKNIEIVLRDRKIDDLPF